jgi:hypothetical protein
MPSGGTSAPKRLHDDPRWQQLMVEPLAVNS